MKLPSQSPPIMRLTDRAGDRRWQNASAVAVAASPRDQNRGVVPADYNNCYNLPGGARQFCLGGY